MVTKSEKKESKDDAHSIASSSQTAEGEADTSVVKHKPEVCGLVFCTDRQRDRQTTVTVNRPFC